MLSAGGWNNTKHGRVLKTSRKLDLGAHPGWGRACYPMPNVPEAQSSKKIIQNQLE